MTDTKQKRVILLLLVFLLTDHILAQPTSYIDGKIINSSTNNPVPFATVRLKNNQLGVYANADGDFKVSANPEFFSDSLIITCIGFKRKSLAVKDLSSTSVNRIYLTPSIYGLGEVTILASRKKLKPETIVGRAIRRIKNNYPMTPFSYISYYRDYQKKDKEYINLNEAIVQTLDNGFYSPSVLNKYRLLDFRRNSEFPVLNISPYYDISGLSDPQSSEKVIPEALIGDQFGNELFILMVHDALRNFSTRSFSFIEVLSEDFVPNHSFSEPVTVFNNNLMLLKIDFKGRRRVTGDSLKASGSIYIQPKDYSIHKIEYLCYYLKKGMEDKKMFNIDIEYGYENSVDSSMCLKYISFNNIFNVVDIDDNSYFRVNKSYWDTQSFSKPTLILDMNKDIDPVSARKKSNYTVKIGDKKAVVTSVNAGGSKIYIRLNDASSKKTRDSCRITLQNVRDTKGDIVGMRKYMELYQYRELFVQEYNKSVPFTDSCYVKYLPLEQNCKSRLTDSSRYWMNTPENIKRP